MKLRFRRPSGTREERCRLRDPAMNRGAIFRCPSGTGDRGAATPRATGASAGAFAGEATRSSIGSPRTIDRNELAADIGSWPTVRLSRSMRFSGEATCKPVSKKHWRHASGTQQRRNSEGRNAQGRREDEAPGARDGTTLSPSGFGLWEFLRALGVRLFGRLSPGLNAAPSFFPWPEKRLDEAAIVCHDDGRNNGRWADASDQRSAISSQQSALRLARRR